MADLVIATGKPYLVTNPERRASVNELGRQIASLGIEVEVEVVEYEPGRRGISPNMPETIGIFIGSGISGAVLDRLTNALIDRLKNWAGERYHKKKSSSTTFMKGEEFIIYGPDGEVLKTWRVDDSGEHEDYPAGLRQPRKDWRGDRRSVEE